MEITNLLFKKNFLNKNILILTGLSSLCYVIILKLINDSISDAEKVNIPSTLIFFIALLIIYFKSKEKSQILSNKNIKKIATKELHKIVYTIRDASYLAHIHIEEEKLHLLLHQYLLQIINSSETILNIANAYLTSALIIIYICFINLSTAIITVVAAIILVFTIVHVLKTTQKKYLTTYQKELEFFSSFSQLLNGNKELKLANYKKRDLVDNFLLPKLTALKKAQLSAEQQASYMLVLTNFSMSALTAIAIFFLPQISQISPTEVAQMVTVMFFLQNPLSMIAGSSSQLSQIGSSSQSIEKIIEQLKTYSEPVEKINEHEVNFYSLELKNVVYSYNSAQRQFTLGPINLLIKKGDILFITGANGSGKSTILNIICGLHSPHSGTICINDINKNTLNPDNYRKYFAAVFQDYHLFKHFWGHDIKQQAQDAALYLKDLKLEHKLTIDTENKQFSTIKLSSGQRKRLAMIQALIEHKPILILDEFAADLDPEFRAYFYESFLPQLQQQGKTIIVVSHDEQYDRLRQLEIHFDEGKITRTKGLKHKETTK